jgi:hypothetical protein
MNAETVTVDDLIIYTASLEAEVTELEEDRELLTVENRGLRRSVGAYKANGTRRRAAQTETQERLQELESENLRLRRSVAGYKANATRRANR